MIPGRVGVVTTSYPREAGDPAGAFVAGFTRWLAEAGLVVEVVAAGPGGDRIDGLPITRVDGRGLFYRGGAPEALAAGGLPTLARAAAFQAAMTARVLGRAGRWDGAVSHWLAPSSLAVDLAFSARRRPHLAIAHSSDVWFLQRSMAGRAAVRRLSRRADLVYAARHLVVDGAPGRVVPMGIDPATPAHDRQAARERFMLRRTTALFLGRLVPVKGLDVLFQALPPDLDLLVAGDGPLREAWSRIAPPRARFLGEVRGEAKQELLRAVDLLVLPSRPLPDGRSEGTPTVVLEALAAGLPIVATRTGGVEDVLVDGETGLLVDPPPRPFAPRSNAWRGSLRSESASVRARGSRPAGTPGRASGQSSPAG